MVIRDDLSTKLIHFTKGSVEEATSSFYSILNQRKIVGGVGGIKNESRCVCFTESPIGKFSYVLAEPELFKFPYAPLGIMVDKGWLYEKGGRPVIYQSDEEYDLLHDLHKYRHKSYDPLKNIDFTWEREWRIKVDELKLEPQKTTLIVPDRGWVDSFKDKHTNQVRAQTMIFGENGWLMVDEFIWHFIALEDLGVNIKWGKNK